MSWSAGEYDAVIVGGGHNGLVAAHYLATAGMRTVVCERREIVGGCCVTEEFAPGFRASTGAYVLSMLREPIWRDLRLVERGIVVDPAGPSLNLFEDGSWLRTVPTRTIAATPSDVILCILVLPRLIEYRARRQAGTRFVTPPLSAARSRSRRALARARRPSRSPRDTRSTSGRS